MTAYQESGSELDRWRQDVETVDDEAKRYRSNVAPKDERVDQLKEKLRDVKEVAYDSGGHGLDRRRLEWEMKQLETRLHQLDLDHSDSEVQELVEETYEELEPPEGRRMQGKRGNRQLARGYLAKQFDLGEEKVREPVQDVVKNEYSVDGDSVERGISDYGPSAWDLEKAADITAEFGVDVDGYDAKDIAETAYEARMNLVEREEGRDKASVDANTYLHALETAKKFDLGTEKEREAVKEGLKKNLFWGDEHKHDEIIEKGREYGVLFDSDVQDAAKQKVQELHDQYTAKAKREGEDDWGGTNPRHRKQLNKLSYAIDLAETFGISHDVNAENLKEEYVNGYLAEGAPEFAVERAQELDLPVDQVENVAARAARELLSEGQREEAERLLDQAGHAGSDLTTLFEAEEEEEDS